MKAHHPLQKQHAIDAPWLRMTPISVGDVPATLPKPSFYITVGDTFAPLAPIDVYMKGGPFEAIQWWAPWIAIGIDHDVFLVDPTERTVIDVHLGGYSSSLYAGPDHLLVASSERMFRLNRSGGRVWKSRRLGMDGVVIHSVSGTTIHGEGEWDPPGGWKPFEVDLATGRSSA